MTIEHLMSPIVEAAAKGVALTGGDGGILLAKAECEIMFGRSSTELLGIPIDKILPARFRNGHAILHEGDRSYFPRRSMGKRRAPRKSLTQSNQQRSETSIDDDDVAAKVILRGSGKQPTNLSVVMAEDVVVTLQMLHGEHPTRRHCYSSVISLGFNKNRHAGKPTATGDFQTYG